MWLRTLFAKKDHLGPVLMVLCLAATSTVDAQGRWQFELCPSVSYSVHVSGGPEQHVGFGSEALAAYALFPSLYMVAGSGWQEFPERRVDGRRWVEAGYRCGLRYVHPFKEGVRFMLEGGTAYDYIAKEGSHEDPQVRTKHGFGWLIGCGASLDIGPYFNLMPILKYQTLVREHSEDATRSKVTLCYISVGIGAALRL